MLNARYLVIPMISVHIRVRCIYWSTMTCISYQPYSRPSITLYIDIFTSSLSLCVFWASVGASILWAFIGQKLALLVSQPRGPLFYRNRVLYPFSESLWAWPSTRRRCWYVTKFELQNLTAFIGFHRCYEWYLLHGGLHSAKDDKDEIRASARVTIDILVFFFLPLCALRRKKIDWGRSNFAPSSSDLLRNF